MPKTPANRHGHAQRRRPVDRRHAFDGKRDDGRDRSGKQRLPERQLKRRRYPPVRSHVENVRGPGQGGQQQQPVPVQRLLFAQSNAAGLNMTARPARPSTTPQNLGLRHPLAEQERRARHHPQRRRVAQHDGPPERHGLQSEIHQRRESDDVEQRDAQDDRNVASPGDDASAPGRRAAPAAPRWRSRIGCWSSRPAAREARSSS